MKESLSLGCSSPCRHNDVGQKKGFGSSSSSRHKDIDEREFKP